MTTTDLGLQAVVQAEVDSRASRLGREFTYLLSLLQGFALVSPFERLSHCAVEVIDEFKDAGFQVSNASEIGTFEQLTHQNTEPNLDLI